jgi:hypothetical protein
MNNSIVSAVVLVSAGLWVGAGTGHSANTAASGPEGQITVTGGQVALGENGMHPPFAYGKIAANGTIISGSSNITGVSVATGRFTITVDGGFLTTDIVVANDIRFARPILMNPWITGGTLEIWCWNPVESWELRDDVSFVVYRP